ncbi:MAG: pyrroline-5-carboxylate reductase [Endozoicomonas sp.]
MPQPTITFIGAGNMASSIIGGLIDNGWPKGHLIATARTESTLDTIKQQFKIKATTDNHQAARQADIIILCVKPQVMKEVLADLSSSISPDSLLISVAAGINMSSLEAWTGKPQAIIRSMPNTPSLLQCGASGLFANTHVSSKQKAIANNIFSAIGIAEWVKEESLIDAVIAVSGSGPAYYFLFMEVMEQVGVKLGLNQEISKRLTQQTALGAARMAQASDVSVDELKRRVMSPNGTTEQAINTFMDGQFPELIEKAMNAVISRSIEMADALKD